MLQEKAAEISANLVTVHKMEAAQVGASPFITFLLGLLKTLLPMLVSCLPVAAKGPEVAAAMKQLGILQRWHVRRTVRSHIGEPAMNDMLAGPVTAEILKLAASATDDETQQALDEL